MSFWNDPSALLPKQSHRWIISFGGEAVSMGDRGEFVNSTFAKSVDKPSYKIDSLQAKYLYSHTFNFPKRLTWNPIKIEFYDIYDEKGYYVVSDNKLMKQSVQAFFYKFLKSCGYFNPNEQDSDEEKEYNPQKKSNSKYAFNSYHFKENMIMSLTGQKVNLLDETSEEYKNDFIRITELDGDGNFIEEWDVHNPLVTGVNFNKLDYSSDNILTVTVDLVYDWAELRTMQYDRKKKKKPETKRPNTGSILGGPPVITGQRYIDPTTGKTLNTEEVNAKLESGRLELVPGVQRISGASDTVAEPIKTPTIAPRDSSLVDPNAPAPLQSSRAETITAAGLNVDRLTGTSARNEAEEQTKFVKQPTVFPGKNK